MFSYTNGNLSQYPTIPIYGNVLKDEDFYIASIVFPFNQNNDGSIKYSSIKPRLYFLTLESIQFNNFAFNVNDNIYPYPPSTCKLSYLEDITLKYNKPPFSMFDFIFTENTDNAVLFNSNSTFSKNVKLKYYNNGILSDIKVNSFFEKDNNAYTDLFSINSSFVFDNFDLYNQQNTVLNNCNEIFNFVFIPKNSFQTYIQGLLYTGIPLIMYYGTKSNINNGSDYLPIHNRYLKTCKSSSGCIINPNQSQLQTCYNDYPIGDLDYICNSSSLTSIYTSNDIVADYTNSSSTLSNDNIDYLNYYLIPKKIYDKNGNSFDGKIIAISYFNYYFGFQSDYVENTHYYTKSILDTGIPSNTNFKFEYCNNTQYLLKNKNGYGCSNCFSIARNIVSEKECQCSLNVAKINNNDLLGDLYFPTKDCSFFKNCYCNMPRNYVNEDGFIYCGDQNCNCSCDIPDVNKRCKISLCSFFTDFIDDNNNEDVDKNTVILWILIGIGILIFIIIMIFIIISLRKEDVKYKKELTKIEIYK